MRRSGSCWKLGTFLPHANLDAKDDSCKKFLRYARSICGTHGLISPICSRVRLRGPKRNGAGTAPNVRGWGARQLTIGMVCLYALLSGTLEAYKAALLAVAVRTSGDVMQNLLDGCYWKLSFMVPVELGLATLLYVSLFGIDISVHVPSAAV
jgi:hypothetical protein